MTYHVHEYDKVNQTTTVDFFNLSQISGNHESGDAFNLIQKSIPSDQNFYLIIVNSSLNPGGVLEINGQPPIRVTDYQASIQTLINNGIAPHAYSIQSTKTPGVTQLTSLKIAFDNNTKAADLLVPTNPDCVFINFPGAKGEYRDGALVIQAIHSNQLSLNSSTLAQNYDTGLIWEGIIYNHYMIIDANGSEQNPGDCYTSKFY